MFARREGGCLRSLAARARGPHHAAVAQTPPIAAKRPTELTRHGNTRTDDYAWLRDPDWRRVMREPAALDGEIRAYLEAENAYAQEVLAPVEDLRLALVAEMKARIKQDDSSVPSADGDYAYYRRYAVGWQHPVFCRRAIVPGAAGTAGTAGAAEEVLLDGDREARDVPYFRVAAAEHSPDHTRLAYAADRTGGEEYGIRVRDLVRGADLADAIERASGDIVWAGDGSVFYYIALDANHRPSRVYRHALGSDPGADPLIHEEADAAFYLSLDRTEDRRFVTITAHSHALTTEVHLIDATDSSANDPSATPRLFARRADGVAYEVSAHDDRFLILTNADGAVDFKIMQAPLDDRASWRDLVPHRPGRLIRRMLVFADHLVRLESENGLPRIVITRLADGEEHDIAFAEEAYELRLVPGYRFDTATLRFAYASPTTPEQVFDYDMNGRTRVLMKQQDVPSGHDPAAYVTRRITATSYDGAQVPITVLHRRDTAIDGSAPLLLYGYGAYGISMPAGFATNRLSLVDRGFVYAIAHIRGGTEKGYQWYFDGKLANKINTFLDFIAAAEALVGAGYTSAGRIAAHGGSAGGMLMGAVANMRPDLFRAIIADVPFVDVLTTMCDAELPLTPPEWSEWGNPIEQSDAYARIQAYSPYDNVIAQPYPHMLVTAGLTDPRVTYWEPAKWVARLRALKTDGNPLVLRTNMEAGHGGAAGRFDKLDEVARAYAFALLAFGMAA